MHDALTSVLNPYPPALNHCTDLSLPVIPQVKGKGLMETFLLRPHHLKLGPGPALATSTSTGRSKGAKEVASSEHHQSIIRASSKHAESHPPHNVGSTNSGPLASLQRLMAAPAAAGATAIAAAAGGQSGCAGVIARARSYASVGQLSLLFDTQDASSANHSDTLAAAQSMTSSCNRLDRPEATAAAASHMAANEGRSGGSGSTPRLRIAATLAAAGVHTAGSRSRMQVLVWA